jgi:mono/diheme cytochrome c family protein
MFRFRVIAGLTLCVGLAAAAAAQDAKVAQGEKVYAAQKCALCHSVGDKGNKKGPLDGVAAKLKADDRAAAADRTRRGSHPRGRRALRGCR